MGRGKVELKRIENPVNRQVSFSKRRKGLLKKAHELAVLCDVELGVVIFSGNGKVFEYSNPPGSLTDLIHRYEAITNAQLQETFCNDQQRVIAEIVRLRREKEQLEASTKRLTGEDLSSFTSVHQLSDLEQHLESALGKVHARKDELLTQLIEELQCKINENGHAHDASASAAGVEMEGMGMAPLSISPPTLFGYLLAVDDASTARTALQLWPQRGDVGCSSSRGLQLS